MICSVYQIQHNYGVLGLPDRARLVAYQISLVQKEVEGEVIVIATVFPSYRLFLFNHFPVVLQDVGLAGGFCIR